MTIGVEFGTKLMMVGPVNVKLQIWDTAGCETFRSISNSYYRGSHAVIFVYDITKRESFNNLNSQFYPVAISNSVTSMAIVGNKSDLSNEREV